MVSTLVHGEEKRLTINGTVNYAFALISTLYELMEMAPGDDLLWRTTALKQRNSALKVFLSVGG